MHRHTISTWQETIVMRLKTGYKKKIIDRNHYYYTLKIYLARILYQFSVNKWTHTDNYTQKQPQKVKKFYTRRP